MKILRRGAVLGALLGYFGFFVGSPPMLGAAEMIVDAGRQVRPVPPGVVGWGAMWKHAMLWPPPPDPQTLTDAGHRAYIERLARELAPLIEASDTRHLSWPWGVSFSTWGVNWENSARPWSQRPRDCARIAILNRGSGWCEKAIIGVGDLMTLVQHWRLEAITVSVPLAVLDGTRPRWGPGFTNQVFDDPTIEKVSDHARGLVDFMRRHPAWGDLKRIYLAAGCEWRHYRLRNPSPAVLTYAKLVRRIREKIPDSKVIVVASASDSADLPGPERTKANSWNRYLYEELVGVPGIALDLHRYRGMIGLAGPSGGPTPLNAANIDRMLATGVSQRDYLVVEPEQWGKTGAAMPSVLLENAIHGLIGDHATHSDAPRPWPAVMAHADLVREALASDTQAFLGWTFFPEALPKEWPHGALRQGQLSRHARAQAFLSSYHRGHVLDTGPPGDGPVRGNATRAPDGAILVYGGNFSRQPQQLVLRLRGASAARGKLEILEERGQRQVPWDGRGSIALPPMSLWRVRFSP